MARRLKGLLAIMVAVMVAIAGTNVSEAQTLGRERLDEARKLSETEMAALLMGLLSGRTGVTGLRSESGDVVFRVSAGHDVRMGLAPLAAQFNALPDARSRQGAFDKLSQRIAEAVVGRRVPRPEAEAAQFRASLVLVMKNRAYLDQFAAMARKQGAPQARLLHVPIAGDIIVIPARDQPKMMRFVTVGEGADYGMSDADVLRTAMDNWVRRVDKLEIREFGKLRAFHFGNGDYNASIVLLPNPWRRVPDLPRNVAVAVPSRDMLAFADADDPEAVAALRRLTKAPDGGFPVSKLIYRLSSEGLTVVP